MTAKKEWSGGDVVQASDLNDNFNRAIRFGGDGSDGAQEISSGVTDIDVGAAQIYILNYTTLSITGTGKLTFSNQHANGTIIIIRVQGDVTLTSSQTPMIDLVGMGATGGAAVAANTDGAVGLQGSGIRYDTDNFGNGGLKGDVAGTKTGGVAGTALQDFANNYDLTELEFYLLHSYRIACGSGAGSGGGCQSGGSGNSGVGGRGGGAMLIECAGAWNFTTAGGIDISGEDGGDADAVGAAVGSAAGGGGGSVGMLLAIYNELTANTGTVTQKGGDGGLGAADGGNSGTTEHGGSGGGGAGFESAGGDGGDSLSSGSNVGLNGTNGGGAGGGSGRNADGSGGTTAGGTGGTTTEASLVIENKFNS